MTGQYITFFQRRVLRGVTDRLHPHCDCDCRLVYIEIPGGWHSCQLLWIMYAQLTAVVLQFRWVWTGSKVLPSILLSETVCGTAFLSYRFLIKNQKILSYWKSETALPIFIYIKFNLLSCLLKYFCISLRCNLYLFVVV